MHLVYGIEDFIDLYNNLEKSELKSEIVKKVSTIADMLRSFELNVMKEKKNVFGWNGNTYS